MSNKLISQMGLPSSLVNVFAARNILIAKDALSLPEFDLMTLLDVDRDQRHTHKRNRLPSLPDVDALAALSLVEDRALIGGYLPTRLLGLDRALCGGIPFGSLTELVGPSGIGKTQMAGRIIVLRPASLDELIERNQAKLQRNLMYLAAIADSQQQAPTIAQFSPNNVMQSGPRYMQQPQAQPMTPKSLMAARTSMLYGQSPISNLQQQQQQQAALHSQLGGVSSGGSSSGFNMLHGESGIGSNTLPDGVFSDFGRGSLMKQDAGNALS